MSIRSRTPLERHHRLPAVPRRSRPLRHWLRVTATWCPPRTVVRGERVSAAAWNQHVRASFETLYVDPVSGVVGVDLASLG